MYAIRNRSDPSIFFHLPENWKDRKSLMKFRRGAVPRLFRRRHYATSALSNWIIANGRFNEVDKWEIIPVELKEVKGDEAQSQTTA